VGSTRIEALMVDGKSNPEAMSRKWDEIVEDLAEGRMSVLDLVGRSRSISKRDYFGYVQHFRTTIILMRDLRILKRLHQEMAGRLQWIEDNGQGPSEIDADVLAKDGLRLSGAYSKMLMVARSKD
jgi:hypothetical protein